MYKMGNHSHGSAMKAWALAAHSLAQTYHIEVTNNYRTDICAPGVD